jgi:hypothetical protein
MHIDPPVVTDPNAKNGPRTGLGDTQIYNFTLTKVDIGLPDKITFAIGPLIAVPASTSTNFGSNSLQGVSQGSSWRHRAGVSSECWGPISTRCGDPALN